MALRDGRHPWRTHHTHNILMEHHLCLPLVQKDRKAAGCTQDCSSAWRQPLLVNNNSCDPFINWVKLWNRLMSCIYSYILTHSGLNKTILQITFSNAFPVKRYCILIQIYSYKSNSQLVVIGSGNGLAPCRQQTITWSNDASVPLICTNRSQWVNSLFETNGAQDVEKKSNLWTEN